ncbi:glycosyltransferase [Vibrio diabolicus]|uniref:glycosyltransferase family 2 protein n=2 Tax=Bacteria TaxID=2 RepID=UPI0021603FDB|nr:glycosyltransferase [Vibrio diabolicus]MCS0337370.1 glycosyltransferase [Vibrio diabolicus]
MKVSVCIVTYNHQDYISECIESVLNQKVNFDFEIIIAQDCSTDKTGDIVREFKAKYPEIITLIDRDVNVGVMQNYEDVFKLARGEYISFLDGDDYMLPEKLSVQVDILDNNHDCNIASHPLSNFESKTGVILSTPHKYEEIKKFTLEDMIVNGFLFSHSSKMFRRSSLPEEIVDKKTKNCTDYLLHMQNCLNGKVIHINKVLGMHRVHSSSLSRSNMKKGNISFALNDQIYALDKISKATDIDSITLSIGYKRVLLWGLRKSFLAKDFQEIIRIKSIWSEKLPLIKIPITYTIISKLKPLTFVVATSYSLAFHLRGLIRSLRHA